MEFTELLLAPDSSSLSLADRLASVARLLEVTRVLAAEIALDQTLDVITREACRAVVCERASLYRYDPKRDELYTTSATELEIAEIRRGLGEGICGHAARNREMVNVPDPAADARWSPTVDLATGFQTRNILAAPVVSPRDDALLGVLQLLNNSGGAFDRLDEELLALFCKHAAIALDRARMTDELRAQDAVENSLSVARSIQRGFMPQEVARIPGYDVATWWYPNQAVGADYCDVLRLHDGRIGLVIADVSGHGIGPSLLMASARAALRALALDHSPPEVLMTLLGRAMERDLQSGRFITMFLAAIDATDHTLVYANAGHAPADYFRCGRGECLPLAATGLPLGVIDRPEYPQGQPLRLEPGDLVLLCTDGIVEAADADGDQFGHERLTRLVAEHRTGPLENLVAEIGRAVGRHYVGDDPPDDLTILALRRQS